jgi:glycosyltransferase involved in cell wall biosynthesis
MKIAIDVSPIDKNSNSQHKIRGVGKYISLLKENLEKYDKKNSYFFVSNVSSIKENIDLIHIPYFDPFFPTLPKIKKIKIVVTVHDVIPLVHKKEFPVGLKGNLKWKFNKILLKRTDGIITDSIASKEDIIKVTKIAKSKIFPVLLSVDKEFKSLDIKYSTLDLKKKFNLPEKYFLYVGDVTWNKNLPRVVEAIKSVNIPLVMIGKALVETEFDKNNPWNKDRLKVLNMTKDNSLFIKLGFVGTSELVALYKMAQALLMPSLDEGFGLPVLEAMSAGCPVITSRCGSLPEVGGDAVIYVDAENVDDIARSIVEVYEDKNLRESLIIKGKKQAEKFSLQKMIENTVKAYEGIGKK